MRIGMKENPKEETSAKSGIIVKTKKRPINGERKELASLIDLQSVETSVAKETKTKSKDNRTRRSKKIEPTLGKRSLMESPMRFGREKRTPKELTIPERREVNESARIFPETIS